MNFRYSQNTIGIEVLRGLELDWGGDFERSSNLTRKEILNSSIGSRLTARDVARDRMTTRSRNVDDNSLIDPGDTKSELETNLMSNSRLEMESVDSK